MKLTRKRNSAYPRVRIPRRYRMHHASDLNQVKQCIEHITGKSIVIESKRRSSDETHLGLLVRRPEADYVSHSPSLSELHIQQMILHEFAHIIQSEDGMHEQLQGQIPMDFRSVYEEQLEFHAEALADLLAATIRRNRGSRGLGSVQRPIHEGFYPWLLPS